MIKISVLYPGGAGTTFDMAYYLDRHIPVVRAKLGAACKSAAVEQGLGGATLAHHQRLAPWAICILIPWRPFRRRSAHTLARSWATFLTTPTYNRRFRWVR